MPKHEHNGVAPRREDGRDLIEVHVAGVCVRIVKGEWRFLAAKRTDDRSLYPGQWECGGGQVRAGEDFPGAVKRQMFEEFGLNVELYSFIENYAIPVPQRPHVIPGIRFLCIARDGHVKLNRREFSCSRWLPFPAPKLDWIGGLHDMLNRTVYPILSGLPADAITQFALPTPKPPDSNRPGFISAKTKTG